MKTLLILLLLPFLAVCQNSGKDINYITQISKLERKIDSLNQANEIQYLKYKATEHQDVINKVNDFYDSAWLKLVLYFAALSVLVPVVISWFQQRNFKSTEERIFKQLDKQFQDKLAQLQNKNADGIKKLTTVFDSKIEELSRSNSEELAEMNNTFSDVTKSMKEEYNFKTERIESNFWLYAGLSALRRSDYSFSTGSFIVSMWKSNLFRKKDSIVAQQKLQQILESLIHIDSKDELEQVTGFTQRISSSCSIDNLLIAIQSTYHEEPIIAIIDEIKQHLSSL